MKNTSHSSEKIVLVKDEKKLRHLLEKGKPQVILGAEKIHYKDSLHYLRSGLDQITCKIAKKKDKTIGFSFETLRKTKNPKKQASLLTRMQQNMRLCKKYGVNTKIFHINKNAHDSFERILKKQS